MRSARATNLASREPATSSTGIVSAGEAVPQRVLGAGPGQAQARGQARRPCCGDGRRAPRSVAAWRTAAGPPTGRGTRRRRRARSMSASCSSAARRAARSSASSMPGRGADQHEPLDELGPGDGEVQAEAPAHRVADVRGRPAAAPEQLGAARRGRPRRRPTRRGPGDVDGDDLEALGQAVGDGVPRAAGLGEPVDEHERAGRCPGASTVRRSAGTVGRRQPLQHLHEHGGILGAGDRPPAVDDVRRHGGDAGLGGEGEGLGELGLPAVAGQEAPGLARRRDRPRPPTSTSTSGSPTLRPSTK